WRSSWMDRWYSGADRPANGSEFVGIFREQTRPFAERLEVAQRKIVDYEGNEALAPLTWEHGAVELMYVDCGRTFEVNDAWWRVFEPSFIPDRTIVIMQDWQLYKEEPPKPYNQTKLFTDSKRGALELVHELAFGDIGAFIYRGPAS